MAARDKLCKVFVFAYPRSCLDNYFEKKHGYYPNFNSIVYLFICVIYLFNPEREKNCFENFLKREKSKIDPASLIPRNQGIFLRNERTIEITKDFPLD